MQIAEHIEHARSAVFAGQYLSADEVGKLAALLQELRDVTQSRRTFAATDELLARLKLEAVPSHLVHDDTLEY